MGLDELKIQSKIPSTISNSSSDTLVTPGGTDAVLPLSNPGAREDTGPLKDSTSSTEPTPLDTLLPKIKEKFTTDPYIKTADIGIYELVEEVHPLWIASVNLSRHYEAVKVYSSPLLSVSIMKDLRN